MGLWGEVRRINYRFGKRRWYLDRRSGKYKRLIDLVRFELELVGFGYGVRKKYS